MGPAKAAKRATASKLRRLAAVRFGSVGTSSHGAIRGAAQQAMLDPDGVDIFDALDDIDRMIDAMVVAPTKRKRSRN